MIEKGTKREKKQTREGLEIIHEHKQVESPNDAATHCNDAVTKNL